jgi:hypothetical protein
VLCYLNHKHCYGYSHCGIHNRYFFHILLVYIECTKYWLHVTFLHMCKMYFDHNHSFITLLYLSFSLISSPSLPSSFYFMSFSFQILHLDWIACQRRSIRLVWVLYILWLLVFCRLNVWQKLSTILCAISSLCWLYPLLCRSFLIWFNSICRFLLLFTELLNSYLESHCLCLYLEEFSSFVQIVRSSMKVFDPFWVNFFSYIFFSFITVY